ncbi:hypothetical protein [[Pseudomonas] boreopolis]|uniref:hypothetical protein n=1 Tax=Xanthomonas boreopolis TaxID=86183 RepID=UPI003D9BBB12
MPVATITTVFCFQQATGVDGAVNTAVFALVPDVISLDQYLGRSAQDVIRAMPGVLQAIDQARADPDQLYITTSTAGGRDNAIWPAPGADVEMQAGQSNDVNLELPFEHSLNLSLWDYDSGSGDDLLGSVTLYAGEQGAGEKVRKAWSSVEGSCYFVTYRVD